MADQKLNQIYVANPASTLGSNDLIYILQSPYSSGTDAAMIGSVFNALYAPLSTKGDIYTYSSGATRLAVGSNNQILQANSGAATGLAWSTATYPATTSINQILYSSSNNVVAGISAAASSVLISSAGSVPSFSTTLPSGLTIPGYQTTITPAALTRVDDTNVTLTLGGSPSVALLAAASLTLGWTGTLSGTRGGTGVNNGSNTITIAGNLNFANAFSTSGNFAVTQTYTGITNVTFPTSDTLATTSQLPSAAALTKTDDTNVTLTLGGTPATSLLQAVSLTLGWTGQLGVTRGGTGLSAVTAHYLPIGNGTSALTLLAPSATSGVPLISQGASSDPIYGTAVVAGGGTGNTTFTAYSVICAGTTATGAFQNVSGVGTSGQVLTSNGASALPTWQTPGPGAAVLIAGTGTNSIKTTFGNDATALRGIRIGIDPDDNTSAVIGDDGVGIGSCSYVGTNAICIGLRARCQGTDAIAIGSGAKAGSGFGGGSKCISLGNAANTGSHDNALVISTVTSPHNPSNDGDWILEADNSFNYYAGGVLAVQIGSAQDLINLKGTADQSYSLQTPSTGFSITIGAGVKTLILNPSGTLATGTVTMPASPIDGQEIRVSSSQTITALTVSANTGKTISNAPTTLTAGSGFAYIYNLSGTNWYRLY